MATIIRFACRSERERERLIREARAMYDSIFPSVTSVGDTQNDKPVPQPSQYPDIAR